MRSPSLRSCSHDDNNVAIAHGIAGRAATPSEERVTDIPQLTSIRFFLAALVAAFHIQSTFGFSVGAINVATAISFFFVLSGFVLTYRYLDLRGGPALIRYYIARLARIWPLHLATALYFLMAIFWPPMDVVALNLLLLQSWSSTIYTAMSMNGVAWSISVELFFYLMLPLVLFTRRYITVWLVAAAGVVLIAIWLAQSSGQPRSMDQPDWYAFLHVGPPARFIEFLAGVTIALIYDRIKPQLSRTAWSLIELVALAAMALAFAPPRLLLPFGALSDAADGWLRYSGTFPLTAAAILIFAYSKGIFSRVLSITPLVFLGEASFALYMVHQLVYVTWLYQGWVPNEWDVGQLLLILTHIAIATLAAFLLIERPCRRAILALTDTVLVRAKRPTQTRPSDQVPAPRPARSAQI